MSSLESKVLKKKKVDNELTVKVTKNEAAGRIFVEFSAESSKLVLQKSFQNTYAGFKEAEDFEDSIKSIEELKSYFGIKEKKNVTK